MLNVEKRTVRATLILRLLLLTYFAYLLQTHFVLMINRLKFLTLQYEHGKFKTMHARISLLNKDLMFTFLSLNKECNP